VMACSTQSERKKERKKKGRGHEWIKERKKEKKKEYSRPHLLNSMTCRTVREPAWCRGCCEVVTEFRFMVAWRKHACIKVYHRPLFMAYRLPLKRFTGQRGITRKNIHALRYIRTRCHN
jgi:hypothetical protein